ncbi:AraC-type DNA-binding protein [Evansella caseinilytica]|uniref:AraC-type DNA-binding protein n=1 Tax=Evansella caseinilytica TaxID=1503961 RepID=A0A1H3HZM3_9BACI|nr:AraC-type DNA-binding protein [Evansella caseinilytica]
MNDKIAAVLEQHEQEDRQVMNLSMEEMVKREFAGASKLIEQIQVVKNVEIPDTLSLSINNALIRVANEFSIRKHTSCLFPYHHSHDFYELIYVCEGTCIQYVNEETKELILYKGEACLLAPGMIHALMPSSSDDLILKFILPQKLMNTITERMVTDDGKWLNTLNEQGNICVFSSDPEKAFLSDWLVSQLLEETFFGSEYKEPAIHSFLTLLFVNLARKSFFNYDKSLLQTVSIYIRNNLQTASLSSFAAETGYSTRHLGRMLHERTGGTFSDIVQRIKVEEAAKLLAETDLTIDHIAEKVGYKNASGLHKRFVAVFGMTPGAYRKMHVYK